MQASRGKAANNVVQPKEFFSSPSEKKQLFFSKLKVQMLSALVIASWGWIQNYMNVQYFGIIAGSTNNIFDARVANDRARKIFSFKSEKFSIEQDVGVFSMNRGRRVNNGILWYRKQHTIKKSALLMLVWWNRGFIWCPCGLAVLNLMMRVCVCVCIPLGATRYKS